jgi:hypothetical protein
MRQVDGPWHGCRASAHALHRLLGDRFRAATVIDVEPCRHPEFVTAKPHNLTFTYRFTTFAFAALGALTLSACTESDTDDFISDDPTAGSGGGGFDEGGDGGTGGDPAGEGGDGDNGDGDAPDISEADIIQLEGDRLYALSAFSGLTVVDMADPDELRSLGTWETDAEPFEMYVEAGQAFVMFNDYGFWEWDESLDEWSYSSSSRLVALDASNPSNIVVKGEFTLPGRIQDSRRIGDILYLVTLEDGWCWGCDGTQKTVVTSLDISNEANPHIVDQHTYAALGENWNWQRSVESTTERMYLASSTWWFEGAGSVIDVVDISAGDGTLATGVDVEVAGSVFNRWQMNEHNGVLRVISQPGSADPVIETFQVVSAQEITPIGSGTLNMPVPESLRSVRYDGDRAYAITAEQTDPLFTIDLSDPANPQQVGELEIPGWVYHMEPRGDRVLALGFDNANPEGSINVSLFDVSNFAAPALIRRVHFGGDWASFAEDQNFIHKSFAVLEDENMLLVPHTGWEYEGEGYECSGTYRSGVQIIDWQDDDLTLRGLVPSQGRVRRAFTYANRIVTVSDTELASFDYADRDAPMARDSLGLAVHVDKLIRAGEVWVRLAQNWYTSEQLLEVVDPADPGAPDPLGVIDLGQVSEDCEWSWIDGVYVEGDHVFVVRHTYAESWDGNDYEYSEFTRVIAVDISNPTAPVIVDSYELPGERSWGLGQLAGVVSQSNWVAHLGDHLAFSITDKQTEQMQVQVLDLSDPSNIELSATLARPEGQTQGELSVLSDTIVSWHTEPVEGEPGKVRFYFDRLDLDGEPHWQTKVNVPGIIVAYDAQFGRAFTVDFDVQEVGLNADSCYAHPKFWSYEYDENYESGTCYLIERTLKRLSIDGSTATLVDSIDIEGEGGLEQLHATGTRIFAKTDKTVWDTEGAFGEDGDGIVESDTTLVVVDIAASETVVHQQDGEDIGQWWWISAVDEERAVVQSNSSELTLIDATNAAQLEVVHSSTPAWGGCYSPVIDGDTVYCPMGPYGLETVEW